MDPVIIEDLFSIDIEPAAIIALGLEGVAPPSLDLQVARKSQGKTIVALADRQRKVFTDPLGHGSQGVEIRQGAPGALVVFIGQAGNELLAIDDPRFDPRKGRLGNKARGAICAEEPRLDGGRILNLEALFVDGGFLVRR